MTIQESNKLIAQFMGAENTYHQKDYCTDMSYSFTELKFHSSWDWLMPVVEKCFSVEEPKRNACMILNDAIISINIQEVYKTVVQFIQWYNKKQGG